MRNIFLIFLFTFSIIKPNLLFAQQFGIKAGIGLPSIYKTDEVSYYRNRLNHESNPSFISSLRLKWHLTGNFYLAWEPGVIEKSGRISGIAVGFDSQNKDIYGYYTYKLWNINNSILLNYYLFKIKDIKVNIYLGPGVSFNISDIQGFGESEIPYRFYNDHPYDDYENPYITNNSGFYLNAGINLEFLKFQFDIRYMQEYSNLWINGLGKYKTNLFCFLISYEI